MQTLRLLVLAMPACLAAQGAPRAAARNLGLVRAQYSGEKAKETVAYLDRFVRWPGNAGFDSSIAHVAKRLADAGYVEQGSARPGDRLTFRIERYPMSRPAWEPLDATIEIVGAGRRTPVLALATNRNLLATNSFGTAGVEAELVHVAAPTAAALDSAAVRGKIVMTEGRLNALFAEAVQKRGALGVMAYGMPAYTLPQVNQTSIQFGGIPYDSTSHAFGVMLSYAAHEQLLAALRAGPVRLHVATRVKWTWPATELTVVAEIRGSAQPDERFVYSAHAQEPGANDNASGVGSLTEAARVAALLVKAGRVDPRRTITFLFGLEIQSTDRFIRQDTARARGIRWGMSLDMVGEDTKKTGGTFLIEKMPDPSAVWTRGDEHHTEWGGSALRESDIMPHYFNDYVLRRCLDQAEGTGWVVKTNPYEGGSDHIPFIRAKKAGLLMWHFTDHFYHTDGDRMGMVSADELRNVGIASLVSGLTLAAADGEEARAIVGEVEQAALARLAVEQKLSAVAIGGGSDAKAEAHILETWGAYYRGALKAAADVEVGGSSAATNAAIAAAVQRVDAATVRAVGMLPPR
jgi:aminopeptidase YwaD